MKRISVCMATYNGADYLQPQIDSILSQLSDRDELIISDDSSTDQTIDIIQEIADSRIRLFHGQTFHNPIFNFEYALQQVSGDIIFLADQDDLWVPNKVNTMVKLLDTCDLAVSDCDVIDQAGNQIHPSFHAKRQSGPGLLRNILKNTYLGCCMAFQKHVLEWALPFPKDIPMHDMWLGTVAEMLGKTRFSSEILVHYRRHSENASSTFDPSPYSAVQKTRFRFILMRRLFQRYWQIKRHH